MLCLAECVVPGKMEPAKGNYRAVCADIMDTYAKFDPWFGIEQEYTFMEYQEMAKRGILPYSWSTLP